MARTMSADIISWPACISHSTAAAVNLGINVCQKARQQVAMCQSPRPYVTHFHGSDHLVCSVLC